MGFELTTATITELEFQMPCPLSHQAICWVETEVGSFVSDLCWKWNLIALAGFTMWRGETLVFSRATSRVERPVPSLRWLCISHPNVLGRKGIHTDSQFIHYCSTFPITLANVKRCRLTTQSYQCRFREGDRISLNLMRFFFQMFGKI